MPVKLPIISGSSSSSNELINFPLSIQTTQPTAIRDGHIWVNSNNDSKITKVKILETLNTEEENGTLVFVVGDLDNSYSFSFSNILKSTSGVSKTVSMSNTTSTTASWNVISNTGDTSLSFKINTPFVYSKIDGVLNVETAYIWNQSKSSWDLLSQGGQYLYIMNSNTGAPVIVANKIGDTLVKNTTLTDNIYTNTYTASSDGTYICRGNKIYKRNGDTFSLYFTIPFELTSISDSAISSDGQYLVAAQYSYYDYSYTCSLKVYINNGSTFTLQQILENNIKTSSSPFSRLLLNKNGTFIIAVNQSYTTYVYYRNGSTWTKEGITYTCAGIPYLSYDDKYLVLPGYNYNILRYTIDFKNKKLDSATTIYSTSNYTLNILGIYPLGLLFIDVYNPSSSSHSLVAIRISDAQIYTSNVQLQSRLSFNIAGDRAYCGDGNYYAVSISGTSVTFSLISNLSSIGNGNGILIPY